MQLAGLRVPPGFAVTAQSYLRSMNAAGLLVRCSQSVPKTIGEAERALLLEAARRELGRSSPQ